MSPERKAWIYDHIGWMMSVLVTVVVAVSAWLMATYTEVVRHGVRIEMAEKADVARDAKSEQMVRDLSEIKFAVVKLATIAESAASGAGRKP